MKTLTSLLTAALLLGCGGDRTDGPPRIVPGSSTCAACGMTVADPRYAAAARPTTGDDLLFDSIECLIVQQRTQPAPGATLWLTDHPSGTLYPAGDCTVVRADFPSPMGKGYAAFLDADRARAEASRRGGRAGPLDSFLAPDGGTP